ncbi:MAG: ATP-dependent Clp protease, protease subunit [Candidatus Sumerlaeota bacterium]|nr:ATP-dependent Clp protease, protease subunit [Candidatus Sumerlaeota bacterium]
MTRHTQIPSDIAAGFREIEECTHAEPRSAWRTAALASSAPRSDDDDDDGIIYIPVPRVIEETERGERVFDLYSRLLVDRIILINRDFDDRLANLVTAQLLFLESQDADKPISMYINSPGGVISSGMAIYDTMQLIKPSISTTVIGQAASMGAVILLAGAKGSRYALPNARIMIHQPSGGSHGTSTDIEIQTQEMMRIRESLYTIMANHTGHTVDEIKDACDRDNFMSPEEAIEFGIIDSILPPKKLARA